MGLRLICVALLAAVLVGACSPAGPGQPQSLPAAGLTVQPPSAATASPADFATVTPASAAPAPTLPATTAPATTATAAPANVGTVAAASTALAATMPAATATVASAATGTPPAEAAGQVTPGPDRATPAPADLVAPLRQGGYVLYFRHAATTPVPDDADPVVLADCATQRNLSPAGREQAAATGAAIKRLAIPIGVVLASPFCRALDTARLAFGAATPEPLLENLETAKTDAARAPRIEGLRRLLAARPDPGTNTVLVAHGVNISAAAGVSIAEGEAAIFRPDGAGGFTLVGRLTPGAWAELAASLARGDQGTPAPAVRELREYRLPAGEGPHDVAPAADGTVWYTAQAAGALGRLDPRTGQVRRIPLGEGSAPHGVIVGPDGAAWVTDGGLNAIVRVDPATGEVRRFPLPADKRANLNTATFERAGTLWFTGQSGYYGRVDPASGRVDVFDAPGGAGPYGITTTPGGDVYYASLAGSHIARINPATGQASVIQPPTAGQGARRIWSDSRGRLWVSEWNAGQLGLYDPAAGAWREWKLPGPQPRPYAVYVDERDMVWLSDWGSNALVRFDPATEQFTSYPLPSPGGLVRQLLGRPGEVWGAESAAGALVVAATQ